jgi:hypothetical protein
MVAIRKTKAKEEFGPDPSLDLPQGAHLKVMSSKLFAPKFHEETGDLWKSVVSCKLKVVNDRTANGAADGLEFFDSYELKFDEDVAKRASHLPMYTRRAWNSMGTIEPSPM